MTDLESRSFHVQVKWRGDMHFSPFGGTHRSAEAAAAFAAEAESMGDGARVKSSQVVDDRGNVVYAYGKYVEPAPDGPAKGAS